MEQINTAITLWNDWCQTHSVSERSAPLFELDSTGILQTKIIGKNHRLILCRSAGMESLVVNEVDLLVEDWSNHSNTYDGLIYLMFERGSDGSVIPLYIGKTETFGKGDGNLSGNIKNLRSDKSKFARWGDGYAYHIGDLSAVTLTGHDPKYATLKYQRWSDALFVARNPTEEVRLKRDVQFWCKAWKQSDIGIWKDMIPTRLTFLEYMLIGVASSAFPDTLLNVEGKNR